jgi:inosine-uridine nucleoside N-ribohydrolase
MPKAQKIIIDTDPGQDDAVAILLALASPELDILGITAVAGNVPLRLTEKNARKICERRMPKLPAAYHDYLDSALKSYLDPGWKWAG